MIEAPLADRLRPKTLKDFVGQKHLVGLDKPLLLTIQKKTLHSMIFWGPPGCGKTTLARLIAQEMEANFVGLSAVSCGKADIKKVVAEAKATLFQQQTILFLDEIHRFNKLQQDYLLPFVETGTLTLIGATTENPSFTVISPLLSRCQVFVLESLTKADLKKVLRRGLKTLSHTRYVIDKKAEEFLLEFANGDCRQLLNLLEATHKLYHRITVVNLKNALQSKFLRYDRAGEEHFNTISAFIKSLRASDVDAALYYLARMVDSGEDPLFIARRMVVFASEDIGMAQPTALVVANDVFRACETIGLPECQENLAHGVVYLSLAKKNRSAYDAYMKALADVKQYGNLAIPLEIRNPVTKLMKNLGYGAGYEKYPKTSLLPDKLKAKKYYNKIVQ
ncbi:AAA family ATPase [Candidatus Beckwithbacteria bacterium CG2_30_44_31]|uniref:AAA family ATPase n=1 Tax=Candidatus Beckwithbacteria bacterium CG2_30_44_31 TaxID=1805035 RepID=A0A1J5AYV5_9BACT|nr:MAG: AAA family ATPase [Candidatus Beckwithbacteria bacterium CG2_30_44_31]